MRRVGSVRWLPLLHGNAKRLEVAFSDLEKIVGDIFKKIRDADDDTIVAQENDIVPHVYLSIEEEATLRKFMFLSEMRNKWAREDWRDSDRANNHVIGPMVERSMETDGLETPELSWLGRLLYLLETPHAELLEAARTDSDLRFSASDLTTYKHYAEEWDLHIWRAGPGRDFFLPDSMVGFEGEADRVVGWAKDRPEMIVEDRERRNHVYLPIDPKHVIVLCNDGLCWDSPFAAMLRKKDPNYPPNSLLAKKKRTIHLDPSTVFIARGGKQCKPKNSPASKLLFQMPQLGEGSHRVINCYTLNQCREYIVYTSDQLLEQAIDEAQKFREERKNGWTQQGIRCQGGPAFDDRHTHYPLVNHIETTPGAIRQRSKVQLQGMHIGWTAAYKLQGKSLLEFDDGTLLNAFLAAFPPKPGLHRRANGMSGLQFIEWMRPKQFVTMVDLVRGKMLRVMANQWNPTIVESAEMSKELIADFIDMMEESIAIELIRWLWEERQDIIYTFFTQVFKDDAETRSPPGETIRVRLTARS